VFVNYQTKCVREDLIVFDTTVLNPVTFPLMYRLYVINNYTEKQQ